MASQLAVLSQVSEAIQFISAPPVGGVKYDISSPIVLVAARIKKTIPRIYFQIISRVFCPGLGVYPPLSYADEATASFGGALWRVRFVRVLYQRRRHSLRWSCLLCASRYIWSQITHVPVSRSSPLLCALCLVSCVWA